MAAHTYAAARLLRGCHPCPVDPCGVGGLGAPPSDEQVSMRVRVCGSCDACCLFQYFVFSVFQFFPVQAQPCFTGVRSCLSIHFQAHFSPPNLSRHHSTIQIIRQNLLTPPTPVCHKLAAHRAWQGRDVGLGWTCPRLIWPLRGSVEGISSSWRDSRGWGPASQHFPPASSSPLWAVDPERSAEIKLPGLTILFFKRGQNNQKFCL